MNKYIKKIRVALLALTTISLLAACGGGGNGVASSGAQSSTNTQSTAVTCDGVCFKVGAQK
jgi:ABC-type glycerol-3-phosphate transport system substrate-binding protein